jgi:ADP-heptose:LPS heptosyltransferase
LIENSFNPQNILVIHFGQMGDVILSLPALQAIRGKFPVAKLTSLVGKSSAEIAKLAGVFDDEIVVDRVELRDGKKLRSINQIRRLVKEIRRRKFDFIIDLHSLSETNLLGFLTGAKRRLYANRENRSLDILGKFPTKPPLEDKSKHITERYLDVLKPLGIENVSRYAKMSPSVKDVDEMKQRLDFGQKTPVGLFLGAGHPSRYWGIDKFAELTARILQNKNIQPVVILGPEEKGWRTQIEENFPRETIILDNLTIPQLLAVLSLMRVFISNDTGPMHLAAVAGAAVVMISDKRAPTCFYPLTEKLEVVRSAETDKISVEEVFQATQKLLNDETV